MRSILNGTTPSRPEIGLFSSNFWALPKNKIRDPFRVSKRRELGRKPPKCGDSALGKFPLRVVRSSPVIVFEDGKRRARLRVFESQHLFASASPKIKEGAQRPAQKLEC